MRSPITTHVLDTARGRPASGVPIRLERTGDKGGWLAVADGVTDADGRIGDLLSEGPLEAGTYRMVFDTGTYFRGRGQAPFYPTVAVVFEVDAPSEHYHIPLLLSPYGYSTYRGS